MFSLIIGAIGIVLVAILAIVAILYLNNPGKDGIASAKAAQYLQEGSQIMGSLEIYKVDHIGELPSGSNEEIKSELLDKRYLQAWPDDERWTFIPDYVVRTDVQEESCKIINRNLGVGDTIPQCSDEAYRTRSVCCTEEPPLPE